LDIFTQLVLQWFVHNGRDFPWRKTSNPYHVFLAEILLRQTQANRVVKTYLVLLEKYPSADALSHANVAELRILFQPLGLIKRADLLVRAAKYIMEKYCGLIPNNVDELSTIPGMGIYSSRAVVCLAFGKAEPMVDESTGRLLRRVFNLTPKGPAYSDWGLLETAKTIVPSGQARSFNLGLLDIASAYCHYTVPDCKLCPLSSLCFYSHQHKE
jgi:A/G-specific adenine glycosylase